MSQDVFKAPKAKRKSLGRGRGVREGWSPSKQKRRRTADDFMKFCNIVLEYTQYEQIKAEELRTRNNSSPLDSGGSTGESVTSESTASSETEHEDKDRLTGDEVDPFGAEDRACLPGSPHSPMYSSDSPSNSPGSISPSTPPRRRDGDDSWDLVTCYCMKPFSGRPMIECNECNTWIHLSCAKIRRSSIPDVFECQLCKDSKLTTRKSNRIRSEKKLHSV